MMKKFEKTEEEEKEKKKEPEEESRVKMLTRRWNERDEKDCEKDDVRDDEKMGGRRMKRLSTFRLVEQQLGVKNTDEKIASIECQTSDLKFIFRNHPRNIVRNGRSEENPDRRRGLPSGLRESQTKEEEKRCD